jgi:hypothetical protein
LGVAAIALLAACTSSEPRPSREASRDGPPQRPACADRSDTRNLYWGDLHVHTGYSFDAWTVDIRTRPDDAYAFAAGKEVQLPPFGPDGRGTRTIRLDRPLDFAAVTDHSELLGEVSLCIDPSSTVWNTATCVAYRGEKGLRTLNQAVIGDPPRRIEEVCGKDGARCAAALMPVWQDTRDAAERWNDHTDACRFTTFVAYEYTGAPNGSNLHRNVIFRGTQVPRRPISYVEEPTPLGLWRALRRDCLDAGSGCDALAIPHNSNWSNGRMFHVEYLGATTREQEVEQANLRASVEPLVEIFQHKGDSECRNGMSGVIGAPDELCDWEKLRPAPEVIEDCEDGVGSGAMGRRGCVSRYDWVRNVLAAGVAEEARIGVNPYKLGIIAGTDTHNGTPGYVDESRFEGHFGVSDDTPEKRLALSSLLPGDVRNNPGGLVAVWAEENSRSAIFDALRRREVYGTSGPRIAVRFFGGWNLTEAVCRSGDFAARGYAAGVPMGATLPAAPPGARSPSFAVSALRDTGTSEHPGGLLQRIQIIKAWADPRGLHHEVHDVIGTAANGAGVDSRTCEPDGPGLSTACAVWSDPDFDPEQGAVYYARVVENPSCRYSTRQCLALPAGSRPPACSDPSVPRTIQERAWTSPIWYTPSEQSADARNPAPRI